MSSLNLTKDQFCKLSNDNSIILVYSEIACDFITPVGFFSKIQNEENTFILESVENSEQFGRFTFIGMRPKFSLQYTDGKTTIKDYDDKVTSHLGNPLDYLKNLLQKYSPVNFPAGSGFLGGAVGYLSYETISLIEEIQLKEKESLPIPDCYFILPKIVIIFDHLKHTIKLAYNAYITKKENAANLFSEAEKEIEHLKKSFIDSIQLPLIDIEESEFNEDFSSNMSPEYFKEMVAKAKDYIVKGDAIQIVLSQRFSSPFKGSSLDLYRALRIVNPSPYMFLMNFPGFGLIGSSPEILVKEEAKKVTIRPIAGTRKRGLTDKEDKEAEQDLLSDKKELAEHVMLVDLARNDIGRVCKGGSIKANKLMTIERYSHVMHIVSNVIGELNSERDAFDLIRACFPAGTVSGAPKIRAMEIIDELEPTKRSTYAGAVCHFDFGGNFDSCITIRTILLKDNISYIQAGAGIVYDSNPEKEYEETLNKAKGMIKAVNIARSIHQNSKNGK